MSAKFDWIWALGRETRMTDGERYVLTLTALRSAHPQTLEFCVRQSTVAENFTVSVRLVKMAWAAGREYGYITLVAKRKRGTGRHGADTYRLTIPTELGAHCAPINSELGAQNDRVGCTDRTELGARPDAVNSENVTPTWSLNGLGMVAAAAPPPEPSRHCQRHPAGTTDNCGACGTARKEHEAWKTRNSEHLKVAGDQRRQAIAECPLCDEAGWLLDDDGLPNDDGLKCDHKENS